MNDRSPKATSNFAGHSVRKSIDIKNMLEILSASVESNRRAKCRRRPVSILLSGESPLAPLDLGNFEGEIHMSRLVLNPVLGSRIPTLLFAVASVLLVLSIANAQGRKGAGGATPPPEDESASTSFREYRGVQLGMMTDEVRKKLGDPKDKGDEQDFYIFNDTETAQIVYDKTHKVVTISADFINSGAALSAKQVFGAEVEAKADGSVYKMVRYAKAGYWLSYNRTSGASPLTTITLQKIQ
jgi:hypothetical protein